MAKPPVLYVVSPRELDLSKRAKTNSPEALRAKAAADKAEEMQTLFARLVAALAAVNGRASQFTITRAVELRDIADDAESIMDRAGLAEKYRVGAEVVHVPAGPAAKAYKHAAISTRVTLARKAGGVWVLANVERVDVYPRQKARTAVHISQEAADAVMRNALAPFTVRPAVTVDKAA